MSFADGFYRGWTMTETRRENERKQKNFNREFAENQRRWNTINERAQVEHDRAQMEKQRADAFAEYSQIRQDAERKYTNPETGEYDSVGAANDAALNERFRNHVNRNRELYPELWKTGEGSGHQVLDFAGFMPDAQGNIMAGVRVKDKRGNVRTAPITVNRTDDRNDPVAVTTFEDVDSFISSRLAPAGDTTSDLNRAYDLQQVTATPGSQPQGLAQGAAPQPPAASQPPATSQPPAATNLPMTPDTPAGKAENMPVTPETPPAEVRTLEQGSSGMPPPPGPYQSSVPPTEQEAFGGDMNNVTQEGASPGEPPATLANAYKQTYDDQTMTLSYDTIKKGVKDYYTRNNVDQLNLMADTSNVAANPLRSPEQKPRMAKAYLENYEAYNAQATPEARAATHAHVRPELEAQREALKAEYQELVDKITYQSEYSLKNKLDDMQRPAWNREAQKLQKKIADIDAALDPETMAQPPEKPVNPAEVKNDPEGAADKINPPTDTQINKAASDVATSKAASPDNSTRPNRAQLMAALRLQRAGILKPEDVKDYAAGKGLGEKDGQLFNMGDGTIAWVSSDGKRNFIAYRSPTAGQPSAEDIQKEKDRNYSANVGLISKHYPGKQSGRVAEMMENLKRLDVDVETLDRTGMSYWLQAQDRVDQGWGEDISDWQHPVEAARAQREILQAIKERPHLSNYSRDDLDKMTNKEKLELHEELRQKWAAEDARTASPGKPPAGASKPATDQSATNSKVEYTPREGAAQASAGRNLSQSADFRPEDMAYTTAGASNEYYGLVRDAATTHKVDPHLITAMIEAESTFKEDAESRVGAQGLMQLMPETAKELGVRDPLDPEDNINGGTKYIAKMLKMFDGNVDDALAAYNWGPGNMRKWIRNGRDPAKMPKETRDYIKKIKKFREKAKAKRDPIPSYDKYI